MNDVLNERDEAKGKTRKFIVQVVIGGLMGGLGMMVALRLIRARIEIFDHGDHLLAVGIGLVMGLMGLFVALGAAMPKAGAKLLNVEDEAELRYQQRDLLWSAIGMILLAAMPVFLALSGAAGFLSAQTALIGLGLAVGALTLLSILAKIRSDELDKAATMETGAYSFYASFIIFGGWAALAHLGLVAPFTMLGFFAGTLSIWLAMLFIMLGKRGMLSS